MLQQNLNSEYLPIDNCSRLHRLFLNRNISKDDRLFIKLEFGKGNCQEVIMDLCQYLRIDQFQSNIIDFNCSIFSERVFVKFICNPSEKECEAQVYYSAHTHKVIE